MNTLSNVEPQGGGAEPLSTGFASDVLPEVHSPSAADSHTGVSTNYTPKVAPRWKVPCWFVLRVTYGRIDKAVEDLKAKNIPTYVPMQYVERIVLGKKKRVKQPLFPNLIFARMTRIESHSIVKSPAPTAALVTLSPEPVDDVLVAACVADEVSAFSDIEQDNHVIIGEGMYNDSSQTTPDDNGFDSSGDLSDSFFE